MELQSTIRFKPKFIRIDNMITNETLFDILMVMLCFSLTIGVITWLTIGGLSVYFRKLDPILLKSPYFNSAEQQNYKEFPLTLYKTLIYIHLFSFRKMTGKRFKGATIEYPGKGVSIASYITATMGLLLLATGALTFALMIYLYFQI